MKTMTQDKAAPFEIKAAAKNAVAGMSYQEAFDHARRLADLGQEIPPREEQVPPALGALQKAEIEKWWPIVKAANIN